MKHFLWLLILLLPSLLRSEAEKEFFDFNFDGHLDYRVVSSPNMKGTEFDVYLYQAESADYQKDKVLSGTVYPWPDPKLKQVICIFNGGHAGAVFSGEVYMWNGNSFQLKYHVTQDHVVVNGQSCYILVKSKVINGKPRIIEIRQGDPMWDDNGMHIK
ncbi:MAG: XAC2610-related protein [Opitutaceae bacterium]